jgi:glucose-6-phosphate 1-dehydrogenase
VAHRDLSGTFVPDMREGIVKGGGVAETDLRLDAFLDRVKYFPTNFDDDKGFEKLKHYLAELDEELGTRGNRLFYLAVAPEYFAEIIAGLGAHGMVQSGEEADNWGRVVIEKPFGTDLASAKKLNDDVNAVLSEIRYFGSITISAKRRCRTFSSFVSVMESSSRSGIGTTLSG